MLPQLTWQWRFHELQRHLEPNHMSELCSRSKSHLISIANSVPAFMRCLQICIQIHNYIICSCCVCSIRPCHFISRICKSGINFLYLSHSQSFKDEWWTMMTWCSFFFFFKFDLHYLVLDWLQSKGAGAGVRCGRRQDNLWLT